MTNEQLADLVCSNHDSAVKVSMSKAGIFLTIGYEHHEITEHQACILWDILPMLAGCGPSLPSTQSGGGK